MFNRKKFKQALIENDLTVADVAKALDISKVTVYRKINGESDFFMSEIQTIAEMIGKKVTMEIFFAQQVS